MTMIKDVKFHMTKIDAIGELFFPMNQSEGQDIELSSEAALGIHEILTSTAFEVKKIAQETYEYIYELEQKLESYNK